eukprot:Phypoly_transcript_14978.p1 GENE.Phypoly_transcript_14978~~Phypoly_transcript_14978.p1  ORF type:complete len:309 (+),score=55.80 Phypoly_transcript_14978:21-947(+)
MSMESSLHHEKDPSTTLHIASDSLPSPPHSTHEGRTRALRHSLLECSALIDAQDAIQQRSKSVFSGWEPVCEIIVSRDDPLVAVTGLKDRRLAKKREITYKSGVEETPSSESDDDLPNNPPTPIVDKSDQRDRKKITTKRPASTTCNLPQLPSPTPSPPSTSPHGPSGNKRNEDVGKRDFLPRILSPSSKKDKEVGSRETRNPPKSLSGGTLDQTTKRDYATARLQEARSHEPTPTKLQMYTSDPPRTVYDPLSSPSPQPLPKRTESSKKSIPELPETASRLQMYYPRSASKLYSSPSNASKKSVNIT